MYRTERGFHAVFHGMDPWPTPTHTGRHAYSEDGITWWGGDVDAFNNSVALVDGGHIQLQRRERPELLHDPETGHPFALISGVSPGWQGDQCFTLIQPVDAGSGHFHKDSSPPVKGLKADDGAASVYDPSKFNEVWSTASVEPGKKSGKDWDSTDVLTVEGSQPLGNGDLTAAAFPELDTGRISMWLSKQDAIADDTTPFKLGQVSLAVEPNPWAGSGSSFFRQTLDFSTGTVSCGSDVYCRLNKKPAIVSSTAPRLKADDHDHAACHYAEKDVAATG